jgi:hypothetical protein
VLCEPLKGSAPPQLPDAVQDVAFDELQVRFEAAPLLTMLCEALIDAVGGGSEAEEPPPPQDISSGSHAAMAKPRIENCMPYPVKCLANVYHCSNCRLQFDERSLRHEFAPWSGRREFGMQNFRVVAAARCLKNRQRPIG